MKIDFRQPPPQASTLEEAPTLINELWSMMHELSHRVEILEEKLRTNSHNSSQPPSTDPHRPPAPKPSTGRKRGAQPGHPGKARSLLPPEAVTHAHVQQAPVVHADETGHKQSGARQWLWVVVAGAVAVFLATATRSTQAARTALGERFSGILVSDRYAAYAWVDVQRRQLCWAHLLRDFAKIAERSGEPGKIGDELIALAQRMFRFWYRVRDGTLSRGMFACHMLFLRQRVETLLRQGADGSHTETALTCRNILQWRSALWTFIDMPGVEPTNNLAERTLRSFVIWRKISFGTQSARGSRYVERIMTVAGSCRLQGRNLLDFLTQTIQAHWGKGASNGRTADCCCAHGN